MRHLLPIIASALMLLAGSCRTIQYVPVEHTVTVVQKDSVYLRDTVLQVEVEKARISAFTGLLDTLSIKTEISDFRAYCDTATATLRGDVRQFGTIPVKVQWKEKVTVRDSLVYQEKPVPVEVVKRERYVPWFWRFFAVLGIVATAGVVFWLLRKFKVL